MSVQVHTYSQPKGWEQHPIYESFSNAIHICATNNQKVGIKERYGDDLKHIYSFREFITKLYRTWYSSETKFQQYLRLSSIIANFKKGKSEIRQAFRTNAMELLDSIRFFVQGNIKPTDLQGEWLKTDKEKLFKDIWEEFIDLDKASIDHYSALNSPISKRLIQKVIDTLSGTSNDEMTENIHIVLHGFYFVTPEQQVVLDIFRNQSINITFFHYYDDRYAETFDFIKAFVNDRFGWPSPQNWNYNQGKALQTEPVADVFLSAFENRNVQDVLREEPITAYSSFFDFLHDVILPNFPINEEKNDQNEKQKDVKIISPNSEQLNELLLSYYPELNKKKRNFLSYPIGRFLVSLHQTYNDGKLCWNKEILMDLFSSGWLYDKNTQENAQNYTYDLQQLLPYFQGCMTINDWISRIEKLIQQGLTIEEAFPISKENRVLRSVRSPFAKIGHFAVPLHRVKQIQTFMTNIEQITKVLFADSTDSKIHLHFQRVQAILNEYGMGIEQIANENEKELIKDLKVKLHQIDDDSDFLYEDLKTALYFYLSGKLDDKDENYITDFIEIDGEMFKSQDCSVYLAGLDENSLPLSAQAIPWPIQTETFDRLGEEHLALQLHTIRSRSNKLISRYLFFIALNLPQENMRLSWIKNVLDQHELQPALYIKQLDLKKVDFSFKQNQQDLMYQPYNFSKELIDDDDNARAWETLAFEDFLTEYELCPKRFYYSYILDEYPTFSSDFIHQFMYSEIIRVATKGSREGFDTVYNEVSELFPQWSNFKKYIAAKKAYPSRTRGSEKQTAVTETHFYTERRKNFQFPGFTNRYKEELFERSKHAFSKNISDFVSGEHQTLPANPGYQCRFCPHVDYCDEATFSIDLRKEDEKV
ncbi:hypothetical protein [Priestia koreensis]|uniref:PD-(D/E)XK endonuclease-like domain-containing protein n=1 Tax=Priestia koreensis TaxID=284581 RepID=A0A0M0KW86_9BACI|nr:hypothetical protein [Priestia koreensis]KOO43085.1 hypothetical protein AMD01_16180 [Priestia koreensis]